MLGLFCSSMYSVDPEQCLVCSRLSASIFAEWINTKVCQRGCSKKFLNSRKRPNAVFSPLEEYGLLLGEIIEKNISYEHISINTKEHFVFITYTCFSFWLLTNEKPKIKSPSSIKTTQIPPADGRGLTAQCKEQNPSKGPLRRLDRPTWLPELPNSCSELVALPYPSHQRIFQQVSSIY